MARSCVTAPCALVRLIEQMVGEMRGLADGETRPFSVAASPASSRVERAPLASAAEAL